MDRQLSTLLPLGEAQEKLLELATPLASETLSIEDAIGRYLAEPITAKRSQPAVNLSAMDGYAIRFADNHGPWQMVGECRAGAPPCRSIQSGECARIFTGAPLPAGADSVMIQENASVDGPTISLSGDPLQRRGQNVRSAGCDFAVNDALLDTGSPVTAAALGLAIASGHDRLTVGAKPRIALLSTGDELRAPGEACESHQIPASCAPMIAGLLSSRPCSVNAPPSLPDERNAIAKALVDNQDADLIVTIGGASVGDHDLVQPVLRELGADLHFWKVAIRPGKPVFAGTMGNSLVLGLPGNPVSAFVTAHLFLLPLVRRLAGASEPLPQYRTAPLDQPVEANGPREHFMRARLVNGRLTALENQDSASLTALAHANALIRRPIKAPPVSMGNIVEFLPLD